MKPILHKPSMHLMPLSSLVLVVAQLLTPLQVALAAPEKNLVPSVEALPALAPNNCRLGLTVTNGFAGYDVAPLRAGSYLDWGLSASPAQPAEMDYIQVVRLKDDAYNNQLERIPGVAQARPGSYWLVGNEPDTTYGQEWGGQDNLSPETYADRYIEVYNLIKANDPTAKVGIGGVTQPTPVRLEYLERVWVHYVNRFGSEPPSDFWHVHIFLLNEVPGEWGAGMPPDAGSNPYANAPVAMDPEKADSLALFKQRVVALREWMAKHNQQNKPLWITEFGVLMPSDAELNYYTISQRRTRNFMSNSFSYLWSARDRKLGLPSDGNRLVQRWYWWTLSADARKIGGAIYDVRSQTTPSGTVVTTKKTNLYDTFAMYARWYGCPLARKK